MQLILLGPPGSGKGTQAQLLSGKLDIPQISTGDIFRENIRIKTELGKLAQDYMDKGQLVPDNVTNEMVAERVKQQDCIKGFILDGYPRTVNQAEFLEAIAKIDIVINLILEEEEIVERISGRRTCMNCEASYHVNFNPPKKKGVCDNCGGELFQRPDDKPEAVKKRLEEYQKKTKPLIEYYLRKNILTNIDASPSIKEIHSRLCELLNINKKFSL
ncbi:adenylate kinase [Candidatus Woesearchaeota archaeon]|nr:adenylate kinase [Candidatus Woesearchaeota archaeon]